MTVPLPNPTLPYAEQDTLTLLAMLLWGECRGESADGKRAVANVVRNRVLLSPKYGDGWVRVMLRPFQFSCFLTADPNASKLLRPTEHGSLETWQECGEVAEQVFGGTQPDPTNGATHYCTIAAPRLTHVWPPAWTWAMQARGTVGAHAFFREG